MRLPSSIVGLGWVLIVGCSAEDSGAEVGVDTSNDENNSQYETRPSSEYEEDNGTGDGDETFDDNQCTSTLLAVLRDFPDAHADFHHSGEQGKAGEDLVLNMVAVDLGPDEKPANGENSFFSDHLGEWYVTKSGVNLEYIAKIELTDIGGGVWSHNNDQFFPLGPNQGYGDEGNVDGNGVKRNFLFTTELRLLFTYEEGQRFRFKGDDDLWVFIDGKLAIDLGGIHSSREEEVDIDAHAARYGMVPGEQYSMHIFHAERNPVESHFRIDTNIECFTSPGPVV